MLFVLAVCDRPRMVRHALESFDRLEDPDWHLAIVDDGLAFPFREHHADFLERHPNTTLFEIRDTLENKLARGSLHGEFLNRAILECPGDIVEIVCDDDAVVETSVGTLLEWFRTHPEQRYSHGLAHTFNPLKDLPNLSMLADPSRNWWCNGSETVHCFNRKDSCQVAYRANVFRDDGIRYPTHQTVALDAALYGQLSRYGPAPFNGISMQYKGVFQGQLGNSPTPYQPIDGYPK